MKHKLKKSVCFFFLLILFLLASSRPAYAGDGVPSQVLAATDGVVRIYTTDGQNTFIGTGFAVVNDENGAVIVTNYHVVTGSAAYALYYDGSGPVALSLFARSETQDLCLLRTNGPVTGLTPLRLCTAGAKTGQAVFSLGYPRAPLFSPQILFSPKIS